MRFAYGALTRYRRPSHAVPLRVRFATSREGSTPPLACPATPAGQRVEARRRRRFGLARFRSPLLARSRLISLPRGTWMFRFPRLPPASVCVRLAGAGPQVPAGSPIRRPTARAGMCPWPWTIAACRVLRRLPVPRHPPRALGILRAGSCRRPSLSRSIVHDAIH